MPEVCVGGFVGLFLEWVPALFFGAIGLLCFAEGILRFASPEPHPAPGPRASAEKPWSHRPDWAQGRVESSSDLAGKWIWAIVWNFLTFPLVFFMFRGITEGGLKPLLVAKNWPMLFWLLFIVVGVVFLAQALTRTYQAARSGRSLFVMSAVPGVIGGTLDGVVHGRLRLRPGQAIRLVLRCHLKSVGRTPARTSVATSGAWEDDREIPASDVTQAGDETLIPVHMTIPATCRETAARISRPSGYDSISWTLEARAEPGSAWRAEFEVPVFRTVTSPPSRSL